ncbi:MULTISPECIES: hypothetical protein [unclassified Providencia]|uniref:hypothetical protein n=1 Tax=unclassified Providencia TaxID=2633465 RepID=UPI00234B7157|nr:MULTISPECIES: hypothetical protein [unclassified Providencia]
MSSFRGFIYDAFDYYLSDIEKVTSSNTKLREFSHSDKKNDLTKDDFIKIYRRPEHITDLMLWPPNIFAVLATFLDKRGGYRLLISGEDDINWKREDVKTVIKIAEHWKNVLFSPPEKVVSDSYDFILQSLQNVFKYEYLNKDITVLLTDSQFIHGVLMLTMASDESFNSKNFQDASPDCLANEVLRQLSLIYQPAEYQLSFTDRHFGSVHQKSTVCQSGVSLNSMSHFIALIKPEITLKTVERSGEKSDEVMNLLILPWPLKIDMVSFQPLKDQRMLEMENDFGFFSYQPSNPIQLNDIVDYVRRATDLIGHIDLLVLPECALEQEDATSLAKLLFEDSKNMKYQCPAFITGTYETKKTGYSRNQLKMFVPPDLKDKEDDFGIPNILTQNKHHRWYLDRPQIFNYKLGSYLSPSRKWWEYIEVSERSLINYRCHMQSIQIIPLICEDLARQDPVAPSVRALGPSLIVALLLDGAQLKNRWPGRYASFLSEDPGSGVLTITPLGMTLRADGTGFPPSRTIAFWSEPGTYRELSLDNDTNAMILTLEKKKVTQWTADGRRHSRVSLHYSGNVCL